MKTTWMTVVYIEHGGRFGIPADMVAMGISKAAPPKNGTDRNVHHLKIWPEFWAPMLDGRKRFEVRRNDRNYQVGDLLALELYNPTEEERKAQNNG